MESKLTEIANRTGRATNIHIYLAALLGFEHYHNRPSHTPSNTSSDTSSDTISSAVSSAVSNTISSDIGDTEVSGSRNGKVSAFKAAPSGTDARVRGAR